MNIKMTFFWRSKGKTVNNRYVIEAFNKFIILLIFFSKSYFVSAETTLDTISGKEIQQATLKFAQNQLINVSTTGRIEYEASPIDNRLSMPACKNPLDFRAQKNRARSGKQIIKVSCNDKKPWSVFIPLNFKLWETVVTAVNTIPRNKVISATDLQLREHELQSISHDYTKDIKSIIGYVAKRNLIAGQPISYSTIKPPKLIKRGDQVVITAQTDKVSVKMSGVAMSDGHEGEQITVKNLSSNRQIKATVTGKGQVKTTM